MDKSQFKIDQRSYYKIWNSEIAEKGKTFQNIDIGMDFLEKTLTAQEIAPRTINEIKWY